MAGDEAAWNVISGDLLMEDEVRVDLAEF